MLTCVSDSPDLEQVLFGTGGVVETIARGSVVVDCSTVSPAVTGQLAGRLAEQGVGMVDAPVSGGSEGAERGTLSVFAGGDPDRRPAGDAAAGGLLRPDHASRPGGRGQLGKAVNQVMIAGTYAGVAEGIALAERAGLPLRTSSWRRSRVAPPDRGCSPTVPTT